LAERCQNESSTVPLMEQRYTSRMAGLKKAGFLIP
jgi:hypothetical protein